VAGRLGDTKTFTRKGLIAPTTTPLAGADIAGASTYTIEQWSVTMDQYGISVDTNMLQSAMTLASKFLADVQTLGINAGQSLNRIARNKMYGRTWAAGPGHRRRQHRHLDRRAGGRRLHPGPRQRRPDRGVRQQPAERDDQRCGQHGHRHLGPVGSGQPDPGHHPGGRARRPGDRGERADDDPGDRQHRVRPDHVERGHIGQLPGRGRAAAQDERADDGGYYTAHIPPDTEAELFADTDFKQALQGRVDSPVWRDLSIGRFAGIDWVRNNETPTVTSNSGATVFRPIVVGAGAVVAAPFEGIGSLLAGTGVEDVPSIRMIEAAPTTQVALIVRPPQDRLQQVISTSWAYTGDFGVPSDSGTGDAALFKRAVVVEHA
jgi:hypothetical protein